MTRQPKDVGGRGTFYCVIDATKSTEVLLETKSNAALPLPVLPIHPFNPANTFFFGIRLRFDHEFESTYAMTSASLYVFSGVDLTPVVRAEWDRRDVGKTQHAQPHWHLLGNQEDVAREPDGFGAVEFLPRARAGAIETERIHFPMSASWHVNASAASCQHRFIRHEDLINWIAGLTKYLHDQFVYVASKTPLAQRQTQPQTVEFNPSTAA